MVTDPEPQWDDDATEAFLAYGEAFVPYRQEQLLTVCGLLAAAGARRVADLCCGEGRLAGALLERLPDAQVQAYDGSERMLEAARAALARFGARFSAALFDVHERAWRRPQPPVDAFVSSLALHHLTAEEKGVFYRDLLAGLTPGGLFVNADLVLPATPAGLSIAADAWDRWVEAYGRTSGEGERVREAFETLRWNLFRYPEDNEGDHPLPLERELELMSAAGFADLDVYWLYAGHAVWGGRKA